MFSKMKLTLFTMVSSNVLTHTKLVEIKMLPLLKDLGVDERFGRCNYFLHFLLVE